MKHRTLSEVTQVADVVPIGTPTSPEARRALRKQRLHRFADLLDSHTGRIRLFSRMEYLPKKDRMLLRDEESPLCLAFDDAVLRSQGLKSDRLGDAMEFFDLTTGEAHRLLCDCHYSGTINSQAIADRARRLANRKGLRDLWIGIGRLFRS